MSENKCAKKIVETYAADCVSGVSWIPAQNTQSVKSTQNIASEVDNAKVLSPVTMVVDNTEGTGAYDDLGMGALLPGTTNFDNGGCSLDVNTLHLLKTYGVVNHVYDKMKRSSDHNAKVLQLVDAGQFDTSTSNSVLNVIKISTDTDAVYTTDKNDECGKQNWLNQLDEHILLSYRALKPGGKAYFKVWKGNGSGIPSVNSSGSFQRNLPASAFLPVVERIFSNPESSATSVESAVVAIDHLNLIIATKK